MAISVTFQKRQLEIPKIKFGEIKNLLDVLTKYKVLGFCRLGLNRMKFYRTKTWGIFMEKFSIC